MKATLFICICAVLFSMVAGVLGYTVTGNKIFDPNGKQVILRGVDRCSLEWSLTGEDLSLADYTLMHGWGANVVRVALCQDSWLNTPAYKTTVQQQATWVNSLGMGIIFDLHWNNGGQQEMADQNSITFWSQMASTFKSNSWVIFELYNEPHDVAWNVWLSGDGNWAGMQQLYNSVRATGAANMVIVNGLNYAFDLSGIATYPVVGTNIAYGTHPYDYSGKQSGDWDAAFGYLAPTYPVIMTEFGQYCDSDTYVSDLLTYATTKNLHWTAWAWYVSGCSFPSIIADWSGTPLAPVGPLVKQYLSTSATVSSASATTSHAASSSTTTSHATTTTAHATTTTAHAATTTTGHASTTTTGHASTTGSSGASLAVYTDSLQNGFTDYSWSTSYSLAGTTYVHSGTKAIEMAVQKDEAVYFHDPNPFAITAYTSVQFYINGGTTTIPASDIAVLIYDNTGAKVGNSVFISSSATANTWTLITVALTSFGVPTSTLVGGLAIQGDISGTAGTLWIDDISFH